MTKILLNRKGKHMNKGKTDLFGYCCLYQELSIFSNQIQIQICFQIFQL
jgi:hypothetical protein